MLDLKLVSDDVSSGPSLRFLESVWTLFKDELDVAWDGTYGMVDSLPAAESSSKNVA